MAVELNEIIISQEDTGGRLNEVIISQEDTGVQLNEIVFSEIADYTFIVASSLGNPVEDANISITLPGGAVINLGNTDSNGEISVELTVQDSISINVSKLGYRTLNTSESLNISNTISLTIQNQRRIIIT